MPTNMNRPAEEIVKDIANFALKILADKGISLMKLVPSE